MNVLNKISLKSLRIKINILTYSGYTIYVHNSNEYWDISKSLLLDLKVNTKISCVSSGYDSIIILESSIVLTQSEEAWIIDCKGEEFISHLQMLMLMSV